MERVWSPPPLSYVKINFFEAVPNYPLDNGNPNGVGIIIRDHLGRLIWGVMGPLKEVSHFEAQLKAIHIGMKAAYSRGYYDLCIETEHLESFGILRRQNFEEADREGLVDIIKAINSCNPLVDLPYDPVCEICPINAGRNSPARFLAFRGMESCSEMVEVSLDMQELRQLLETDIGWGDGHEPIQIFPKFGLGEVIDGPKPKKRKTVRIDKQEFSALLNKANKVEAMELAMSEYHKRLGVLEEAFVLRADPVFAVKAGSRDANLKVADPFQEVPHSLASPRPSAGIKISEPTFPSPLLHTVSGLAPKDKGKQKVFENTPLSPYSAAALDQGISTNLKASEHFQHVSSEIISQTAEGDSSKSNKALVPTKPQAMGNKPGFLGPEVDQYLLDSVLSMVDKPIDFGEFMGLDDVLMEWALMEDLEHCKKSWKPN